MSVTALPDHTELAAMLFHVLTKALECPDDIHNGYNIGWKSHWDKNNQRRGGRSKKSQIYSFGNCPDLETILDAVCSAEARLLEALPSRSLPCLTSYEWLSPSNKFIFLKRLEEANGDTK